MAPHRQPDPDALTVSGTPPFAVVAPPGAAVPVIVHVPHSSGHLPKDVRARLLLPEPQLERELLAMTDHRTDVLAADARQVGATLFVNRWSRLAVDPERFDDPELEEMESVGMGAVYTATSDRRPLRELTPEVRTDLLERHYRPYHAAFTALVGEMLSEHGVCAIIDLHSYPSAALPYELHVAGDRPALDIGTDPRHTPAWLHDVVADVALRHGVASSANSPFSGAFVPLGYLGDQRVHSVMLEFRRDGYIDEATARPHEGETGLRQLCVDVVVATAQRLMGGASH